MGTSRIEGIKRIAELFLPALASVGGMINPAVGPNQPPFVHRDEMSGVEILIKAIDSFAFRAPQAQPPKKEQDGDNS
jgi:hypothetical protein